MEPIPPKMLLLLTASPDVAARVRSLCEQDAARYNIITTDDLAAVTNKYLISFQIDILVVDLAYPADDMMGFLKRLRQFHASLPIVGLSSAADEVTALEFLAHGLQDCLELNTLTASTFARALQFARARVANMVKDDTERQFLNALLQSIPDRIYFKDRDGHFLRASQAVAASLGLASYKALLGRTDADFYHPNHARQSFQDEQEVMRTRQPIVGKLEHECRKDGTKAWVSTTRVALLDAADTVVGTLGISRDVTQLVDTERALNRERLFLRTILDSIQDTIFVKDGEGRYLLSNKAHMRSLGIESMDEIIGKTVFDFFPEDFARPFHEADMELLRSGEVVLEKEERRRKANGEIGWFLTSKIPFRDPQSGDVGIVGISRNITDKKLIEDRLSELSGQ